MRSFSLVLLRRLLFRSAPATNSNSNPTSPSSFPRLTLYDHLSHQTLATLERQLKVSLTKYPPMLDGIQLIMSTMSAIFPIKAVFFSHFLSKKGHRSVIVSNLVQDSNITPLHPLAPGILEKRFIIARRSCSLHFKTWVRSSCLTNAEMGSTVNGESGDFNFGRRTTQSQ